MLRAGASSSRAARAAGRKAADSAGGPMEHFNHDFQLAWLASLSAPGPAILDFGCGKGEVVVEGLRRELDIWGVDVYREGGYRAFAEATGLLGGRIKAITDGRIPFADGRFDVVLSNQVFEHVEPLGELLGEIRRVLKPGGALLAIFPTRECLVECHVNMPLVHRFRPGRCRTTYARALTALGFGLGKGRPTRAERASATLRELDEGTCYRSVAQVERLCSGRFEVKFIEDRWLRARLAGHRRLQALAPLASWGPLAPLSRRLVRSLGETVLEARAR